MRFTWFLNRVSNTEVNINLKTEGKVKATLENVREHFETCLNHRLAAWEEYLLLRAQYKSMEVN